MLSKIAVKRTRGSQYDENAVACEYLRLHVYCGKLMTKITCHASETGLYTFLQTIFHGQSYPDDAMAFINNQNVTMLVTRCKYTNQSTFTDEVVALLA
jgi:hypothetical protein